MTPQEKDRIECAIRHIESSLDVDPWAVEIAVDAMQKQIQIGELPSAQPAPISEAYAKAVFTWLLDYQIKAAELKGRYTPYEVLSWVANDWRKEHE